MRVGDDGACLRLRICPDAGSGGTDRSTQDASRSFPARAESRRERPLRPPAPAASRPASRARSSPSTTNRTGPATSTTSASAPSWSADCAASRRGDRHRPASGSQAASAVGAGEGQQRRAAVGALEQHGRHVAGLVVGEPGSSYSTSPSTATTGTSSRASWSAASAAPGLGVRRRRRQAASDAGQRGVGRAVVAGEPGVGDRCARAGLVRPERVVAVAIAARDPSRGRCGTSGGVDEHAWAALAAEPHRARRRSGPGSPSAAGVSPPACAALGFTLLPLAAYLTKTLQMFTEIAGAVTDWASQPGLQPGRVAGRRRWPALGVVLFVVSRLACARASSRAAGRRARPAAPRERCSRAAATRRPSRPTTTTSMAEIEAHPAQARHRPEPTPTFVDRNRLWSRLDAAVATLREPAADARVRRRPRRVRRQRRRPGAPGRRQADPGRLEVAARPGADRAGARPRRASPGVLGLHAARGAVAARAGHQRRHRGRLPDRRPAAPCAELVASPSAAAAITLMVDDVAHLDVVDSVRASPAVPVRRRASTSTPGCRSAGSTSARSAPRCYDTAASSRWRARSSDRDGSGSSAR